MIQLRCIAALLLLAIWLPASSHSLLQSAGLIHQRHGDHDADSHGSREHDANNHAAADGHCVAPSIHISVSAPVVAVTPVLLSLFDLQWSSEFHVELDPTGLAPPGTAPPLLSHSWQFLARAALAVRAPSLIS